MVLFCLSFSANKVANLFFFYFFPMSVFHETCRGFSSFFLRLLVIVFKIFKNLPKLRRLPAPTSFTDTNYDPKCIHVIALNERQVVAHIIDVQMETDLCENERPVVVVRFHPL